MTFPATRPLPAAHPRPRPRAARPAGLALCVALASTAFAGSTRAVADSVTTTEGLVLEGSVEARPDGSVVVARGDSVVVVPRARVRGITRGTSEAERLAVVLAGLEPDDVEGRLRVALQAAAVEATAVARTANESILAVDPDHDAARRALGFERMDGAWLPVTEARRRRGLVLFDGAWMLPVEAEAAARAKAPARPAADRTLAELLRLSAGGDAAVTAAARERYDLAAAAARHAAATSLLRDRAPAVRVVACRALAEAGDEAALKPLIESALADPDRAVRTAAATAAATFGNDDTAVPFVRALGSSHPSLVANAARALAVLGDARAIVHIVKRISGHGESPRVVVESLTRTSYVRDYDVEIAQASNIANPQIGIVTEGIFFDVKVLDLALERTVVETILVESFNALADAHAADAAGVLAWAREHPEAMRGFPPVPTSARRSDLASRRAGR